MNQADYSNFAALQIQIGSIVKVEDFPRARNPAYKVCVEFSDQQTLWSSAQITQYSKEQLIGRQVVCVTNLPERNIAGFKSQILILGAPNASNNTVLLTPEQPLANGVQIF